MVLVEEQPPQQPPLTHPPLASPSEEPKRLRKLLYTKGQQLASIKLKDVVVIYAKDDDTHLYGIVNGQVAHIETLHRSLASLSALEDEGFYRIRNEKIINTHHFVSLNPVTRQVEFDVKLPRPVFVSHRKLDDFKTYLRKHLF